MKEHIQRRNPTSVLCVMRTLSVKLDSQYTHGLTQERNLVHVVYVVNNFSAFICLKPTCGLTQQRSWTRVICVVRGVINKIIQLST